MALEAANFDGAVFFRDAPLVNCEPLLFSVSKIPSAPCVLTIQGRRRFLLQRYASKLSEETKFIYFCENSTVESILADVPPKTVCVLDCSDLLISVLGVDGVVKLVHRLKSSRMVFAHFPSSVVSQSEWNRLISVADSHFSLSELAGTVTATGVSYKKNGKISTINETVEVSPDLKLRSRRVEKEEAAAPANNAEPTPSAPFNMGVILKETERTAKEQMQLPYMSSTSVEGLVTLRSSDKKVRVGGQIIYTPDDGDDLDDSDPDDDLNL